MESNSSIRRAVEEEAEELSGLAYESKAYWGYTDEFMSSAKPFLAITAEQIRCNEVYRLEENGSIAGFYSLRCEDQDCELVWLFVHPSFIGKGIGTLLWNHLAGVAVMRGMKSVFIVADPNAESFYLAKGARRVGEKPSLVDPSIAMPCLVFDTMNN